MYQFGSNAVPSVGLALFCRIWIQVQFQKTNKNTSISYLNLLTFFISPCYYVEQILIEESSWSHSLDDFWSLCLLSTVQYIMCSERLACDTTMIFGRCVTSQSKYKVNIQYSRVWILKLVKLMDVDAITNMLMIMNIMELVTWLFGSYLRTSI